MKVEAKTIEAFFVAAGEREPEIRQLDRFIMDTLPDIDRQLVATMTMTMLGYGMYHYKYASGKEGDWPTIALAPQKHYISLYVTGVQGGEYLPEIYKDKLGKVNSSKSCIRFKKVEDLNLREVGNILRDTAKWLEEQPKPKR
jgi:hypothetical protein